MRESTMRRESGYVKSVHSAYGQPCLSCIWSWMSCNRLRNKVLPSDRDAENGGINWRLPHSIRFMQIMRKVKFWHLIWDHFSLLIKVWRKCVAFWTQRFEERMKFKYSRHQTGGTLRDQGSRGKMPQLLL